MQNVFMTICLRLCERLTAAFALSALLVVSMPAFADQERTVKVGIVENPPISIQHLDGKPEGLAVDVLEDIATRNDWKLEYVQESWPRLLEKLEKGEIDVQTGIAFSEKRARRFSFSHEALISNWGVVYRNLNLTIGSPLDLQGKRVALIPNSIHSTFFIEQLKKFGVTYKIVPVKSYIEAFEYINRDLADVAVVSRLFGILHSVDYKVAETGISFNPVEVRFASPKGTNADVLATIDRYLSSQKKEANSNYFQFLEHWLHVPARKSIPVWILWGSAGVLFFLCMAMIVIVWLRREVKAQTSSLLKSENRFRSIFMQAASGVAEVTPDGKFLDVNKRFCDILGYDKDELLNLTFRDITHPDDIKMGENILQKVQNGELKIYTYEKRYIRKDKRIIWVNLTGSLILDPENNPMNFISIINDITDRKKTEAALVIAKTEAEKANEAKSEFLAAMSHDLRTPLNAIMGFTDMMRMKIFGPLGDSRYEQYANDIHNSGALLVSLINDILDLSKIEAGKYELTEKPVVISSLIQTCFHQFKIIADSSNNTLSSIVPPDMPSLLGDERVMIQMLNNLVSNAINVTPDGGAIRVTAKVDGSNSIVLNITDTGIGMSEEDIANALNPFEQADSTHSRKHEGTGLGLYLCVNFMRLFGGGLVIESELNKGTTVALTFPPERTISPS